MAREKWTAAAPENRLDALLRVINDTCSVSETAQRVMSLTQAGEVNLPAVVDAVMKDPQLVTELLRLANSPFFGQARQVHDIKRAVVVVGMQEVHNIAAAMSMMAAFSTPDPLSDRLRDTSVLSAAIARRLARHFGAGVDESQAFLAGLLSEIGAMALIAVDSKFYHEIWESAGPSFGRRAEMEEERYSTRSEVVGARVLEANHLPAQVADAVGAAVSGTENLLAAITAYARQATPLIVTAANEGNARILEEEIPALAEALGVPPIEKRTIVEICIQAATMAELSLRGELSLAEQDTPEDEETTPHTYSDPAAFDINEIALQETEARKTLAFETVNAVKSAPVRFVGKRRRPSFMIVLIVVLTLASMTGGAWWYLFLR